MLAAAARAGGRSRRYDVFGNLMEIWTAERQRLVSMPPGPSAPAGAISGPTAKAGLDGDKWNPYSDEERIRQALLGSTPPWQDPLEPYGPALASMGVSFVPGLNSYMVLRTPTHRIASCNS